CALPILARIKNIASREREEISDHASPVELRTKTGSDMRFVWYLVLTSMLALIFSPFTKAQQTKKPFTVADDIAYTHFVPSGYSAAYRGFNGQSGIVFSPNGELVAVLSEHGNLGTNQVDESLRFWRTKDV